jgi:hypothetical protein
VAAIAEAFALPADRSHTAWSQQDRQAHKPFGWAAKATFVAGVAAVVWLIAMFFLLRG